MRFFVFREASLIECCVVLKKIASEVLCAFSFLIQTTIWSSRTTRVDHVLSTKLEYISSSLEESGDKIGKSAQIYESIYKASASLSSKFGIFVNCTIICECGSPI